MIELGISKSEKRYILDFFFWRECKSFINAMENYNKVASVKEEDGENRVRWRQVIRCGDN